MLVAVVLLGLLIGTAQAGILNKVKEAAKEIAEEVTKEPPAGAGAPRNRKQMAARPHPETR